MSKMLPLIMCLAVIPSTFKYLKKVEGTVPEKLIYGYIALLKGQQLAGITATGKHHAQICS